MHFALPTAGLDLLCAVPNFTAIPAVTANPHSRYRWGYSPKMIKLLNQINQVFKDPIKMAKSCQLNKCIRRNTAPKQTFSEANTLYRLGKTVQRGQNAHYVPSL